MAPSSESAALIPRIEWDEPGAGCVYIGERRVLAFNVTTDWSEPWNPDVDDLGVRLLDEWPRLVQERENAYDTARRCADDLARHLADSGGNVTTDKEPTNG